MAYDQIVWDLSPSIHIDIKHALQWLMIRLYGDLSPSIHIDIKHALQWLMIRLYGTSVLPYT